MINVIKKFLLLLPLTAVLILPANLWAKLSDPLASQGALFNNLPRAALVTKEQYVKPERIVPGAMLAATLESLESYISKLVISLPKSLEIALEKTKKGESGVIGAEPASDPKIKEQLVIDLGGVKKTIDYEPLRSIWGMIFMLRDIFKFVEVEAKKQGLAIKSKNGEEPIDWEKIEYGAINAMLSTLDPHSVFLEPKYARDLSLTTKGEFGGVGIVISVRDGFLTVIAPIDGTPASLAGVKAKDRIVKIDEDSAVNMPLEDAVSKLRGAPKTSVKITVQRANSTKDFEFTLKRDIIKVDSVAYALLDNNVGYLRIKAFQGNTAADVKAAVIAMKKESKDKMTGVILDLRDNPGGLLREAISISDLFLEGGEVVITQGSEKQSRQVEMATPGQIDKNLRIAVLINGGSASASEIVSAALKYGGEEVDEADGGRAVIIGDSATFGKGSVQMLFDFPALDESKKSKTNQPVEPAALKLTIAEYYGPKDRIIQTIGVMPDIKLSQVSAEKAEELSLFQNTSTREVDLDAHLLAAKSREEKFLSEIEFLAPPAQEDNTEYNKLNKTKLKEEFAVRAASEFILKAKSPKRKDLLANAEDIKDGLEKVEQKKIIEALKKHGIDWSVGSKISDKDALKTAIISNDVAKAGEKLKLSIRVKNSGKTTAYQVHGITHSKTPLFDQREFLFGKIEPGKEIIRAIDFDIPKDVITRKDLLSLEIRDIAKEKISELNIPMAINGLGRPSFAHMVFVDDAKSGNGDAKVQKGEEVELVVWLKNIGDGKAFEPTVLLRNDSGSKVFLKTGRVQAGELLANQETSMRFAFRVKEATDIADFEIQIFDGQMHDIWRDKVSIAVSGKENPKPLKSVMSVATKTANLYSKAASSGYVLATLKEGLSGESVGELNGYILFKADNNLVGFVKKSDLKTTVKKESTQKKSDFYSINYERVPAKISLKFADGTGWTNSERGLVLADISNAKNISELLIYVNMKKVLYRSLVNPGVNERFSHSIILKPGVNIISLVAREDAVYGQRENITVFYDDIGRVLAVPEKANKPEAKANLEVKK